LYRTAAGAGRPELFSHAVEEFVFVIDGSVSYTAGEELIQLDEGDALWHPSTLPHGSTAGPQVLPHFRDTPTSNASWRM